MSDDTVTLEVDGVPLQAKKGQMIMEVTDRAGPYIPRFCYHRKLTIAANCRMCLVEVEKAPKPMPACATPVGEGMKVFTRSPKAIAAQRATMEFLLINHPLDCPICDQGGECELQDLAMGFGRDISRYNSGKRVVKDQDIGPLISTDMTRCIHCTRCVRFGQEISGIQELGTIGRGENMKISTYVAKSVDHELSANIIDLCPVGALNNKPYRYSARAWEMVQRASVSPHDCVGSNMYAHTLRGTLKRMVPKENEAINETWLADRDRFGFEGMYSTDRLLTPRIRENDQWRDVEWDEALQLLAQRLQDSAGERIGVLATPSATLEEYALLRGIADSLGSSNIDHRLRRRNFLDQHNDPVFPWLGCDIEEIESLQAMVIVGSNLRREVPIIAHRVRKAALNGARIAFFNHEEYEYLFNAEQYLAGDSLVDELAAVTVASAKGAALPDTVKGLCDRVKVEARHKNVAAMLAEAESSLVLLGLIAGRGTDFAALRALADAIAGSTGSRVGFLSEGSNSAGAHLAGVLPHRQAGGAARKTIGLNADEIPGADLDAVLLFGVEPDRDMGPGHEAARQLSERSFVAAMTPFTSSALQKCADLLLPIGTFAETSGTFVNCEGRWQSFAGVANPVGQARPGWKVLRVLGNLLGIESFDYETSEAIRSEFEEKLGAVSPDNSYAGTEPVQRAGDDKAAPEMGLDIPMYEIDSVVRRATALQLTPEARRRQSREEAA
jgi:NADH-quinone oxidoreductase subunit G